MTFSEEFAASIYYDDPSIIFIPVKTSDLNLNFIFLFLSFFILSILEFFSAFLNNLTWASI
jgi:hypothetical protein